MISAVLLGWLGLVAWAAKPASEMDVSVIRGMIAQARDFERIIEKRRRGMFRHPILNNGSRASSNLTPP